MLVSNKNDEFWVMLWMVQLVYNLFRDFWRYICMLGCFLILGSLSLLIYGRRWGRLVILVSQSMNETWSWERSYAYVIFGSSFKLRRTFSALSRTRVAAILCGLCSKSVNRLFSTSNLLLLCLTREILVRFVSFRSKGLMQVLSLSSS